MFVVAAFSKLSSLQYHNQNNPTELAGNDTNRSAAMSDASSSAAVTSRPRGRPTKASIIERERKAKEEKEEKELEEKEEKERMEKLKQEKKEKKDKKFQEALASAVEASLLALEEKNMDIAKEDIDQMRVEAAINTVSGFEGIGYGHGSGSGQGGGSGKGSGPDKKGEEEEPEQEQELAKKPVEDAEMFDVVVKMAYGSTSTFLVEASDTISNLKSLIQQQHSIRRSSQLLRLTPGGVYLEDAKTMAEYGISADPIAHLYFDKVLAYVTSMCFYEIVFV